MTEGFQLITIRLAQSLDGQIARFLNVVDLIFLGFAGGNAKKVRQIIHSGGFEPEDVKLLESVFDASWRQIEGHYLAEGTERDAARERLAAVVVTLGNTCRPIASP